MFLIFKIVTFSLSYVFTELTNRDFYTMIKLSIWRSLGRQKSMCFAAPGWLQGRAAKLLRARRKSRCNEDLGQICLAANSFICVLKVP